MPDYTSFTFDDLVLDNRFRRWVLTNAPAEEEFWNAWLQANPDKLDLVLAARQFVRQMQQTQEQLSDEELAAEVSRIRLSRQQVQESEERQLPNRFAGWLRVAAILTLIGFGTLAFILYQRSRQTPLMVYQQLAEKQTGTLQEIYNTTNKSQLIQLPDGSRVTLYKGSQISFPRQFSAHQREVFLIGEAFFDIVRRPKQPFMVFTNQLTTKVLGTSFTVRAYTNDKDAKVIVRTGKVSVFKTPAPGKSGEFANKEPAFILTPNQQVTFNRQASQMERTLVAMPVPVPSAVKQAQDLVFDHTPVVTVFKKLEATYGIVINYDADLISRCELTAEFGAETLFEKLDLICRATESRYEVIDAQIVVYSKGCH